jgi:hypothetical protein
MEKNDKRKIILIDRKFQFSLILKFIALIAVLMMLFGVFIYLFFNSEIEANMRSAHLAYKNIKDMLMPIVLTISIINLFAASAIIFIFVLFASHRLAGPLYRFEAALKDVGNRNFKTLTRIREGDQLEGISIALRNMVANISGDIIWMKSRLSDLKKMSEGSVNEDIKMKIEEIESLLNDYKV